MTITESFIDFHNKNPAVYKTLVFQSRQYRRMHPTKKLGIATLWENLRWDFMMTTDAEDDFKLNNNHKAHFARMIMNENPDLADLFETRETKAA